MSYNWATYERATGCTKYGPAGCQALMTYLEDVFPAQVSFGICNCRTVAGSSSYSHHAECRAYDEGFSVFIGQTIGILTLELLGPHGRRLGIDHMIVNHAPTNSGRGNPRIYSAKSPQGATYNGVHPHHNHNHIGLTRNAGRNLTYATLTAVVGPAALQGGEFQMFCKLGDKNTIVAYWQRILKEIDPNALPQWGVDGDYGDETKTWVGKYTSWSGVQIQAGEASQLHAKLAQVKGSGGGTTDSAARKLAAEARAVADNAMARLNKLRDFNF